MYVIRGWLFLQNMGAFTLFYVCHWQFSGNGIYFSSRQVKKTPIRPDLEACKEESDDEPERAATETSPPALGAETSKSGRVSD